MGPLFLNGFLLIFGVLVAGCSPSTVVVQDQGTQVSRAEPVGINPPQVEPAPSPLAKDTEQSKEKKIQPEETKQFIADLCSESLAKRQAAIYELNQRLTAVRVQQLLKDKLVDPNCWSFALDAMEKQGDLDDETLSEALVQLARKMDLADRKKTQYVEKRFDPYFERLLRRVRRKGNPGPGLKKLVKRLKVLVESNDKNPAVVIFVKVLEHAEKEIRRHPEIINQLGVPVAEAIQEGIFDDEETSLKFLDLVEAHASQSVQASVYTHIASGIRQGTMTNERVATALLDKVGRTDRSIKDRVVVSLAETIKEKGVVLTDTLTKQSLELFKQVLQPVRHRVLELVAQGVESGTVGNTVTIANIRSVADTFGRGSWDMIAPYFARRIKATGQLGDHLNAKEALLSIGNVASQSMRVHVVRDVAPILQTGVNGGPLNSDVALQFVELMKSAGVQGLDDGTPRVVGGIVNGMVDNVAVAKRFFEVVGGASVGVQNIAFTDLANGIQGGDVSSIPVLEHSASYLAKEADGSPGRVQTLVTATVSNLGNDGDTLVGRPSVLMNSMLQSLVTQLTLAMFRQIDEKNYNTIGIKWFKDKYIALIGNLAKDKDEKITESLLALMVRHRPFTGTRKSVFSSAKSSIKKTVDSADNKFLKLSTESKEKLVELAKKGVEISADKPFATAVLPAFGRGHPAPGGGGGLASQERVELQDLWVKLLTIPSGDYSGGVPDQKEYFDKVKDNLNLEWINGHLDVQHQNSVINLALDPTTEAPDGAMDVAYDVITSTDGGKENVLKNPLRIDTLDSLLKNSVLEYVNNTYDRPFIVYNILDTAGFFGKESTKALVDKLADTTSDTKVKNFKTFLKKATQVKMQGDGSTATSLIKAIGKHGDGRFDVSSVNVPPGSFLMTDFLPKALLSHPTEKHKALEPLVQLLEIPSAQWNGVGNNPNNPATLPWSEIEDKLKNEWTEVLVDQKNRLDVAISNTAVALVARQTILALKIKQDIIGKPQATAVRVLQELTSNHGELFEKYVADYIADPTSYSGILLGETAEVRLPESVVKVLLEQFQGSSDSDLLDIRENSVNLFKLTADNVVANPRHINGGADLSDEIINLVVTIFKRQVLDEDNQNDINDKRKELLKYLVSATLLGGADARQGLDNLRKLLNALLKDEASRSNLPDFDELETHLKALKPLNTHLTHTSSDLGGRSFPQKNVGVSYTTVDVGTMWVYIDKLGVDTDDFKTDYEGFRAIPLYGLNRNDDPMDYAFP